MGRLKLSVRYISLLRWAGAKKWLIPRIQTDSTGSLRYLEPFLGSATVFLNLDDHLPCMGGDESEELINALKFLRDEPSRVLTHLQAMENTKESFLNIRSLDRKQTYRDLEGSFKAARFIYLNHTCFNGLYRVNSRGEFNVPFGHRTISMSEIEARALAVSKRLKDKLAIAGSENLIRADFRVLLDKALPGDFVYLDPPYSANLSGQMFVGYTAAGFSKNSHYELLDWMGEAKKVGIRAMLSNSSHEILATHARKVGLSVETHKVRRNIAASEALRGNTEELLVTNY